PTKIGGYTRLSQKEYTYAKTRCDEVMTNVLQKMEANELVRIQTVGDCLRKWVVSPITFDNNLQIFIEEVRSKCQSVSKSTDAAQRNSDVTRSTIHLSNNVSINIEYYNQIQKTKHKILFQHCECKYMKGKLGKAQIDQLKVICPRQMQTDEHIILCDFKGQIKSLNEQLYKNCTFKEYCWFKLFGLLNKFISMNNIINDIAAKRRLNEEFNRRIDILFFIFFYVFKINKKSYNEKLLYFDVFRFKEFNIHKLIVTTIDYFQIFFAVIPFISVFDHLKKPSNKKN
ncbi:hypothetical protein RFI_00349, partial [Reticulomyxa filosa]